MFLPVWVRKHLYTDTTFVLMQSISVIIWDNCILKVVLSTVLLPSETNQILIGDVTTSEGIIRLFLVYMCYLKERI